MKITDLKTFVVGNPWKNWIFAKLYTDEGITGLGEATGGLSTRPQEADTLELSRHVLGEDPLQPARLWQKMYRARFLQVSSGMNAIEVACWDILGKSLGVPVWKLLGGKHRDRLRVYANGWYQGPREPDFFAGRAAQMVEKGYTALKFDPFGSAYQQIDRAGERLACDIVASVRKAVGPNVDLCIEGHDRLTVSNAIRMGHLLQEYAPMFYETPVDSDDIAATLEVARAVPVAVACGERYKKLSSFIEILSPRIVDIVQPEVIGLGFFSTLRACGIAEGCGALVACHQAQSPLSTAVNAHLHAAVPNFLIQENFDDSTVDWTWDVLTGAPRVEEGYITVPETPGFGIELNEAEAAKHPYGEKNVLRLFEDGWEKRDPG